MFVAHLIDTKKIKSGTMCSYVSAIKRMLVDDGYIWNDQLVLFASFAKACKLVNDTYVTRLPISFGLLEIILFEIERRFGKEKQQPYLKILYQAMIILDYYGLMRIGELTTGPHVVKAKDVHIATNKNKILLILYTSKTHNRCSYPH